jgi:hypothetical protein
MVQMILSSSWNISLEHTNNIMLFVIILLFPKSVLPFHPISCGNFRNGVNAGKGGVCGLENADI